ncbi:malto-oligosyltrehalose trehalohydrolase [Fulvivirga sp. 29W222]|uniref:Malto-oligosyltrehalose trehalohydrolase n=1 Tax=Fulvivirga marina TaxID=2494733 RepID=A0A937FZS0_9BACT|nr:malto-oligosyltrehalose trehalohydrolase [Fulvivirga marina]MBL6447473.1 malto-oligosyltrehalose trehalohydrolase [Fulvivirga marina]
MIKATGAELSGHRCQFTVWAPFRKSVDVEFEAPDHKAVHLEKDKYGYWSKEVANIMAGTKYRFILDGIKPYPDPASKAQPDGVHSWSAVVDEHNYVWGDSTWNGVALKDLIIYEIHIGTFTDEGTFEAAILKLDHLLELGINAIEVMPVAQFPGSRNWGYDGVYPYAVQNSYGGGTGLKTFVDACHQKNIAVILDVVYNHMGPEGNYLAEYGPYFTGKYSTPWGKALNFDDAYSDHVKAYFLRNALMWLDDYHIDGLRLDAVHSIIDHSAYHFLKELRQSIDELQIKNRRRYFLIAESELNDVRILEPYEKGGYGLDAQWTDDFHHAVHALATGEKDGYYQDYGKINHLAKAFRQGFVYDGEYSSFRKKTVGNSPQSMASSRFIVCIQNHDQIGNRMLGERVAGLVSFEMLKLMAGIMLVSPYVPMLFMGEEYGENHPFQYFIHHGDSDLAEAVRKGRSKAFKALKSKRKMPDPQAKETYNHSKLKWNFHQHPEQRALFTYYQYLISLRKQGLFSVFFKRHLDTEVHEQQKLLMVRSKDARPGIGILLVVFNFSKEPQYVNTPGFTEMWYKVCSSSDEHWRGKGCTSKVLLQKGERITVAPESMILYKSENS